jgi:diguanylate cyclase (GGDEF)-like protein/PAS domain S-box-containing protein
MENRFRKGSVMAVGLAVTLAVFLLVVMMLEVWPLPDMAAYSKAYWEGPGQARGFLSGYLGLAGVYLAHVWILWLFPLMGAGASVLVMFSTQNTMEMSMYLERLHAMDMALRDMKGRSETAVSRWDLLNRKLDELFINNADVFVVVDPAKGIRRWNRAAVELARLQRGSLESLEGRAIEDVVPGVGSTAFGRALAACAEKQEVWSGEVVVKALRLCFMASVFPLGDEVALILRDISYRYQDDGFMRSMSLLTRTMVEESTVPTAVLTSDWTYVFASRNWNALLGIPDNTSVVGMNHRELVPKFPANMNELQSILTSGKPMGKEGDRVNVRGREVMLTWKLVPWRDNSGQVAGYIFTMRDQTELMQLRQQVVQAEERENALAYSDALTGLPNRQLFHDRLNMALAQAYRQLGKVALLFLDLDGFKAVNDNLGHDAGDLLLKQVAGRLKECVRNTDTVARLGGDEFTVVLHIREKADAEQVAQKILVAVRAPYNLNGKIADKVGVSIGIALYPQDASQAADLIKKADGAMYSAKQSGKNAYRMATVELTVQA